MSVFKCPTAKINITSFVTIYFSLIYAELYWKLSNLTFRFLNNHIFICNSWSLDRSENFWMFWQFKTTLFLYSLSFLILSFRLLVERIFAQYMVPHNLETNERMKCLYYLYATLDSNAVKYVLFLTYCKIFFNTNIIVN